MYLKFENPNDVYCNVSSQRLDSKFSLKSFGATISPSMPVEVSLEYLVQWRMANIALIAFTVVVMVSVYCLARYLATMYQVKSDPPTVKSRYANTRQQQQRQPHQVSSRTVATQSMCTYRRKLTTPRFEWISPRNEDGVWAHQD